MFRQRAIAMVVLWTTATLTTLLHAQPSGEAPIESDSQPAVSHAGPEAIETAVARARDEGRPIMLFFTGSDWCGYCQLLERDVFSTPEFQEWAATNISFIEVDFPQSKRLSEPVESLNRVLMQRYSAQVRSFPTILFVDNFGTIHGQYGYVPGGTEPWLAGANEIIDSFRRAVQHTDEPPEPGQAVSVKPDEGTAQLQPMDTTAIDFERALDSSQPAEDKDLP